MHKHHQESIQNTINHFQQDPAVRALLLGGSIAHGFESPDSDVDVMILLSDQQYEEQAKQGQLAFSNKALCTYAKGYVDAKYISLAYLEQVAHQGSEPARFAFQGARVLFSHEAGLAQLLADIVRYPAAGKADRLVRFYAQLEAWHWYATEAIRLDNAYLLWLAVSKLVLFGGRLILTHNELLYPYHKWFMRVLAEAKERPSGLLASIGRLYQEASAPHVEQFYTLVKDFREWGAEAAAWPNQFMQDSELNWQTGRMPVDDV